MEVYMMEIRLSKNEDITHLKEIWKVCFGDDDSYIDFFFDNKYKEDQTFVLIYKTQIAAMLTMIPIKITLPNNRSYNSAMLYAIATHPRYQGMGLSTEIMNYTKEYLLKQNVEILALVPAEESLINFYSKREYSDGFYIKQSKLTYENIQELKKYKTNKLAIKPACPEEYNSIRNKQLQGRFYVEYSNDEIGYQKKLSNRSDADIYTLDTEDVKGCLAAERINNEKVIIKELLIPEYFINEVLINISKLLPAKEYILRLPAYVDKDFGESFRTFGMIQPIRNLDINISQKTFGYLGFAYD